MKTRQKLTVGLIVGHRGVFPAGLAKTGREQIIDILKKRGFDVVCLTPAQTANGAVESRSDAQKCADLFSRNKSKIGGVIVTLPNFGDEKAIAETLRMSALNVPVLVHAFSDRIDRMKIGQRRDSFCGKLSVCNNLHQYDIPFTLTAQHTCPPDSEAFARDLDNFAVACRVVRTARNLRIGSIGVRPNSFNTCRYSEKLFQRSGISIETIELSEIIHKAEKYKSSDPKVRARVKDIRSYVACGKTSQAVLEKMAKLHLVLEECVKENALSGLALQCWTAMEEVYGIVPCLVMSMLSNSMIPAACEVDVPGAVSMSLLQAASGVPSGLVDWNNNYGDDPDQAVVFHCSNFPIRFFDKATLGHSDILADKMGPEITCGGLSGRINPGPATFLALMTDDPAGKIRGYACSGEFTDDPLDTFGGVGVFRVDNLQGLLQTICRMGFEHHVAINPSQVIDGLVEALNRYLGWETYRH